MAGTSCQLTAPSCRCLPVILVRFCGQDGREWEECRRLKPARDFHFSPTPGLEPALSAVEGSWANFVSPFGLKKKLSVVSCRLPVVGCQLSVASCRLPVVGCQLSVASCRWAVAGVSCRGQLSAGCPILVRFCGRDGCRLSGASCALLGLRYRKPQIPRLRFAALGMTEANTLIRVTTHILRLNGYLPQRNWLPQVTTLKHHGLTIRF